MRALSLAEQDRLIRQQWPDMRTIFLSSTFGRWRGHVQAFSRSYEIIITYVTDLRQANFVWNYATFPVVEVVGPKLKRREDEPEQPIPHVYEELRRRVLCLFDPLEKGWSPDRPIAETTIPWAADWLRHYEIWQATGEWKGGGRDHADREWDFTAIKFSARLNARVSKVMGMSTAEGALAARLVGDDRPPAAQDLSDLRTMPANSQTNHVNRAA